MSHCSNCKAFHSLCKAECCSVVPMTRQEFNGNFSFIVRPVIGVVDFDRHTVIPETADNKCPFLRDDYACNIYDRRPEICRKFGDESHINMSCRFQKANGSARSIFEINKIDNAQKEHLKKFLKNK
jgi:Fe-S-cluster containining protein